ncbi:MAG: cytochrome c biogenesis protein ResB [Candidatus Latescibacteria bacterium]|nr:cytochrome c biogenesis protein ResB [Candidatus Latescibacterota bacterium]
MSTTKQTNNPGFLRTLSSLQFGIVLLITITVVAVIGTLIPQGRPPEFYSEHYNNAIVSVITVFRFDRTYGSPLFIGLLGLFGLNIFLCSVIKFPRLLLSVFRPNLQPDRQTIQAMHISTSLEGTTLDAVSRVFSTHGFTLKPTAKNRLFGEKGKMGYLGASVVHVSLLVLLTGGMVSLITGLRGYIVLENGESTSVVTMSEDLAIPLGFTLALEKFTVEFYESHPGRPKSFISKVYVTREDGTEFERDIKVNHPLLLNGFNIYQSSYGSAKPKGPISAENDTAQIAIRLKGTPEDVPPIKTVDMVKGDEFLIPGFGDSLKVRLSDVFRDFRRAGSSVSIESPAVHFDVLVNDETRWSVFAFKEFPGLNMPVHDDMDLTFTMTGIKFDRSAGEVTGEPEYYTVLGVVRDEGIPVMWTGALLMMTGLFLSFYIRPRRVWVYDDNGTIYIGAGTKGDPDQFRSFITKVIKDTKKGSLSENNNDSDA